jgi:hypothetical protein
MIVLMVDEDLNASLVADLLKEAGFKVANGQPLLLPEHSEDAETGLRDALLLTATCAWPRYGDVGFRVGCRSHR